MTAIIAMSTIIPTAMSLKFIVPPSELVWLGGVCGWGCTFGVAMEISSNQESSLKKMPLCFCFAEGVDFRLSS
jgi:hypothetical protein